MKTKVVTLEDKDSGEISLNKDVFAAPLRADILHRVVNWQLAKRQAGTHDVKARGEIKGGKKKPFRQKGTGSARQGSKNAPHMRGGGVAMGPTPRSHAHDLPKKIRKLGLKVALSSKVANGTFSVINEAKIKSSKTSVLSKNLKKFSTGSILIIDADVIDSSFRLASSNIAKVNVLPAQGANVYDILKHEHLILTEGAVKKLEERLA